MKLTLLDYCGTPTTIDIDLDKVSSITIEVVSGDEIAKIVYKDGTIESFASSETRIMDFYDGDDLIYLSDAIDKLDAFEKRTSSYDWLWGCGD